MTKKKPEPEAETTPEPEPEPEPVDLTDTKTLRKKILKYFKNMNFGDVIGALALAEELGVTDTHMFGHLLVDMTSDGSLPTFSVRGGDGTMRSLALVKKQRYP
jgi:hypothetical protein